jgi:hypothetical protein
MDPDGSNVTRLTTSLASDATPDWQPLSLPGSKADCRNGGWKALTDHHGVPFKNQGDCVSYVATGGSNPGNG